MALEPRLPGQGGKQMDRITPKTVELPKHLYERLQRQAHLQAKNFISLLYDTLWASVEEMERPEYPPGRNIVMLKYPTYSTGRERRTIPPGTVGRIENGNVWSFEVSFGKRRHTLGKAKRGVVWCMEDEVEGLEVSEG
jgi:hypothetical protein